MPPPALIPPHKSPFYPSTSPSRPADPILRNALRYTISAREYSSLHRYVLSKSPALSRTAPTPARVEQIVGSGEARRQGDRKCAYVAAAAGEREEEDEGMDDWEAEDDDGYNVRAVRHSVRVFVATGAMMKMWEMLMDRLGRKIPTRKLPLWKSPTLRLSVSLSTILLLYRLLFRFLTRLRTHIMTPPAFLFRTRNPRISALLTTPYTPAIGASLAGLALGVTPARPLRVTIMMYLVFRALEFVWNLLEAEGRIWGFEKGRLGKKVRNGRPWWFGSWVVQPVVWGQLVSAAVLDPECVGGEGMGWLLKMSKGYLEGRPEGYGINLPWPKKKEIIEALAGIARLNWPTYVSPTLFPKKEVLPPSLAPIAPITARANPLIKSLSCATLHPHDPSCLQTYISFWLQSFPSIAKTLFTIYSVMTLLPQFRDISRAPMKIISHLIFQSLKLSATVTGALSSAWASLCFFQAWFPQTFLARQRFFLSGFLAGLWAFLERRNGRHFFLTTAKMSVDSMWKVGVKRRWWKGMKGGDVWLFVVAMAVTGVVYERDSRAVRERGWRKGISWVRGEGWIDWGIEETEEEERRRDVLGVEVDV